MDRAGSWDQEYRTNMGGEQSTFTFALRGNGKRGIVHNPGMWSSWRSVT